MELMMMLVLNTLFIAKDSANNTPELSAKLQKKIVEFGWDEPNTEFMREHVSDMEKTPFDGTIFHVNYKKQDGSVGNFTWECWGKKTFAESELKPAIDDLKNTKFTKLTHNFLRFNVSPGDVDWFDDFSAILANAKLASKFAKKSKIKGILFDIEQYTAQLFNYLKQRDSATKSWDQYADHVRKRGREVMEAFQSEYPDVTIFLTFGYCLPWAEMGGKRNRSEVSYGLLAPLLDGMVDSALPMVKIVDGYELAYSYKDVSHFAPGYKMMSDDVLKIVNADHKKYRSIFSFGFGIWMDCSWREKGWNTEDFAKNFYTPDEFEKTVNTAIKTADEYVWIYTETPKWWTNADKPDKLPQQYADALKRAKGEQ